MKRLAAILACVALVLVGCGQSIQGTPRAASFGGSGGEEFANLLTECQTVTDDQIVAAVGGDALYRGFFGAICRWDVEGSVGTVKVTFNWFETGSLATERDTDEKLMYTVTDTTVQGRKAIQAQPPDDPASCGVSAGASDSGIFGWWVQYRPGSPHPDPCEAAGKLAELTLGLSR